VTAAQPRHIGIVAVTAEGAALCYRTICEEAQAILGPFRHPEVTMHTLPLADYHYPSMAGDWQQVGEKLLRSADMVAACGAEFAICPDNTAHQGLDLVRARSRLPWLHIAEEVIAVAKEKDISRLAVLGTRGLMEGPVYVPRCAAIGIEALVPSAEERRRVDDIIVGELIHGRISAASRVYLYDVIGRLAQRGCVAVALACTELPLFIEPGDCPLPVLDSTRILARAALRESCGPGP